MNHALLLGAMITSIVLVAVQVAEAGAPDAPLPANVTRIFDGKSLDGWAQEPLNATAFSGGDIIDLNAFATKLKEKPDAISAFVADRLDDAAKAALAADYSTADGTKALKSALSKSMNELVNGASIYDEARFKGVGLRDETRQLLVASPGGRELMRLNRILLEDAFAKELFVSPPVAWEVRDGAIVSTGAGRGVIYTKRSFGRYRVIFDVKHVSGKPDHRAGVLVFCTMPKDGEKSLDALGGIQFQVPNGGSWDYRIGKNNGGKGLFNRPTTKPSFDEHQWSRVEILVDPATGTARMAVAQPPGAKAVEVLDFKDATAGQSGPFALQMHNRGLFDEYANIAIEENPTNDELITTK